MSGTPPGAGCLARLDVLVLAGGLGLRMRDALVGGPKLLAPVAGRPFLAYLLDWLAGFGARRIVLGTRLRCGGDSRSFGADAEAGPRA